MTSRERIRNLLNRRPTDRIPNGLGGCETAGMHLLAYDKLKKILGIVSEKNRMYTFMVTSVFEQEVLDAINGDIAILGSRQTPAQIWGKGSANDWKDQKFWNGTYQVATPWEFQLEANGSILWKDNGLVCPSGGLYFDSVPAPSGFETYDRREMDPDRYNPSHDLPDKMLRAMEESARWLYENTEYSILCGEVANDLQIRPGGTMNWWMTLASEPEIAHEFLHKACEAGIDQYKLINQAVGKYADMILTADDMGDLRGVTIGPELWREIYKPHYKRLYGEWHKASNMKICLHDCGSIREILDDLIECGVDIINPVQISAKGMDPLELKECYGDRIIFYGGAYDAVLTPKDMPAEVVYDIVRKNIRIFSKNGGYIFAGVHNIPGDIPESHLKAILSAYHDECPV